MTTREHTVYSCDRCRCETLAPTSQDGQRQVWPDIWCLLTIRIWGKSERHLCPRCYAQFMVWLKAT